MGLQARCFFWKRPKALEGRGDITWKLPALHGAKGRWARGAESDHNPSSSITPPRGAPCPRRGLALAPGWTSRAAARASWGTSLKLPYVHDSDFSAAAITKEAALDTGRGTA